MGKLSRRDRRKVLIGAVAVALAAVAAGGATGRAAADEALVFGTNWKAEAEHGGFYQALATGLYKKRGLDVTIRPGGPQVNHAQLMAARKIDLYMGGNLFGQFNFTQNGVPVITVAAIFQKEPQVLLAHPDVTSFEDLKGKTIFLGNDGKLTFWLWLKRAYGLSDDQLKPYTFNPAPFLADKNSVQQGYVTSEPFAIETQGGFKPTVLMMADAGYDTYSTTILAHADMVRDKPEIIQAFVDASIEGWVSYLYGDPTPANELIKRDNPEMTDEQIAFTINAMKQFGIVDSGEAVTEGIGAMTDERWRSFYRKSVGWGLYPPDLPLDQMYTLQFVNKGVGLDLKRQLTGG
jgi:NitT/TauT family transport system substrate-binding protein